MNDPVNAADILTDEERVAVLRTYTPSSRPTGPTPLSSIVLAGHTLADIEREAILQTVEATKSVNRAAAMLGISPRKIFYRLKDYRTGIETATDP